MKSDVIILVQMMLTLHNLGFIDFLLTPGKYHEMRMKINERYGRAR